MAGFPGPQSLGRVSRAPPAPPRTYHRVEPQRSAWAVTKAFLTAFPVQTVIFIGVVFWQWQSWRIRNEQREFDEWMNYQYLEAKTLGLARRLPSEWDMDQHFEDALPVEPPKKPKRTKRTAEKHDSESVFDLESHPLSDSTSSPSSNTSIASSASSFFSSIFTRDNIVDSLLSSSSPSSSASPSSSSPVPPTSTHVREVVVDPIELSSPSHAPPAAHAAIIPDQPVSLATAVPLMLSAEEKKERRRQKKEEMLEALREADMKQPSPFMAVKSPKEIYARELAAFQPKRYTAWMLQEKKRIIEKKKAQLVVTPMRMAKHSQNKQKAKEIRAKFKSADAGVKSLIARAGKFEEDAAFTVLADKQRKADEIQAKLKKREAEENPTNKPRGMKMKERDFVTRSARTRFKGKKPATQASQEHEI